MQSLSETLVGALAGETAVTFGSTIIDPVPRKPWLRTDCSPAVSTLRAFPVAYRASAGSPGSGIAIAVSYAAHMFRYAATADWTAAAPAAVDDVAVDGTANDGEGTGATWREVQADAISVVAPSAKPTDTTIRVLFTGTSRRCDTDQSYPAEPQRRYS